MTKAPVKHSMYAAYFIKRTGSLPAGGVLNWADIFDNPYEDVVYDREFKLEPPWIVLILASLIYSGHLVLVAGNGTRYDASNLEALAKENLWELYHFKQISKPKTPAMNELKKLFNILNIPEGLIVNPNTWEDGVRELLGKSRAISGRALHALSLLNDNFALWGDLLIPGNIMDDYKGKIRTVLDFGNAVNSRFNTPARLQNFDYTVEQLERIAEGLKAIEIVGRFEELKSKCSANIEYFSKVELVVQDEDWKERIKEEKEAFFSAREALREPEENTDYASIINNRLSALKEEYITCYMELHAKCRLGVSESARKGEILAGRTMANLRKLSGISSILSLGKFNELSDELSKLKVCYELSPAELKQSHICPHCHFKPADSEKPVRGKLDMIEERLEQLLAEWGQNILSSIDDPLVKKDVPYLKPEQKKVIEAFMHTGKLPDVVDNHFVEAVNILLKGLEKVEIDVGELGELLTEWGPCTADDMKSKFETLVNNWTRGMDKSRTMIIITRK